MSIKLEKLEIKKDYFSGKYLVKENFEFCIIYNYDKVEVGQSKEIIIEKENIIEAKFFNNDKELVIRRDANNKFIAHLVIGKDDELIKNEERFLEEKFKKNKKYSKLVVKKYFDLDEQSNAYVKYLKPCRFI